MEKEKQPVIIKSEEVDVRVKKEVVENEEEEVSLLHGTKHLLLPSSALNNNSRRGKGHAKSAAAAAVAAIAQVPSCFLHIKEEEGDEDRQGAEEVNKKDDTTIEVSAEDGSIIVIKTEPRVLEEEEEEMPMATVLDDDDFDEECEFEEDDDEDFDFGSSLDTPDSTTGTSSSSRGDGGLSLTPDSAKNKTKEPTKRQGDDEEEDSTPGSFDFNGITIETSGNYSKCPKCLKSIKSTFIIRHIKLHDVPSEKFTCPEAGCSLQVNRINNLFRHLREIHKSKRPYMCKRRDCGARFSRAAQLKAHSARHRAEEQQERRLRRSEGGADRGDDEEQKTYACEFPGCGKEYRKRHHLKEHERKHTGDTKYGCEVCGKRFYIQAHMKRHLYSHTGIKPHICRWRCGAIFASYGGRMKHERINHYDENPLRSECDICGRPFKNQQQLSKHRMTHLNPEERRDYRCSFCHIMFDTVRLRERHEERHRDGEVFACETCAKVFKNEKNLSHHVKTHHMKKEESTEDNDKKTSNKNVPAAGKKPKKEAPPKHHCHICGPPKLFCLTSLRRHLARIHSTNYKCSRPNCGRYFKEKTQLDAHEEIHRLRECHLCLKQFRRKQNADIHLLGVHGLTKDDLATLGRWNPKKETDSCPEYMTRKANTSFKRWQKNKKASVGGNDDASAPVTVEGEGEEGGDDEEEEIAPPPTDHKYAVIVKAEPGNSASGESFT